MVRIEALLAEEPDAPYLLLRRAALHREHGDWPAAAVDLARAAELDPHLAGLDLEQAQLAAASGRSAALFGSRRSGPAPPRSAVVSPSGSLAAVAVLVPPGAPWRYKDDGVTPSATWRQPGFNDSAWSLGNAELGYGDGDENTVVSFGPNPAQVYPTTWFRHGFAGVAVPPTDLSLALLCDDGAIVYLNGVEIARFNLPSSGVNAGTWALTSLTGAEESMWRWFTVSPQLLSASGNVIAVEVHQSSATSSDISLDLALVPLPVPTVARGPWVQSVSTDAATVSWRSIAQTDSEVRWGLAPGQLSNTVTLPGARYDHEVRIGGLPAGTTVYYSIGESGTVYAGDDLDHRFGTAPVGGPSRMRAWVLGDSGIAGTDQESVRDAFLAYEQQSGEVDMLLLLGDNAYPDGSEDNYQVAFFEPYAEILRRLPVWSTLGNHDAPNFSVYSGIFAPPTAGECGGLPSGTESWYSFDWGGVHFVVLDSMLSDRCENCPMAQWLELDLANSNARITVAVFHHPPYSKGNHDSDDPMDSGGRMLEMRENILPILEAGGVDLVLSGHTHDYERSKLLQSHYGFSWQLLPSNVVDAGDGREAGTGAYHNTLKPLSGTVYVVAGSSSKTARGPLNHPVMVTSGAWLGSLVLEVVDDRLDLVFLDSNGAVGDHMTLITHDPPPVVVTTPLHAGQAATIQVRDGRPGAPFILYSGTGPGSGLTPQGPSGLAPPVTARLTGVFGPMGTYQASQLIPAALAGRSVALQAVEALAPGQYLFGPVLQVSIQ